MFSRCCFWGNDGRFWCRKKGILVKERYIRGGREGRYLIGWHWRWGREGMYYWGIVGPLKSIDRSLQVSNDLTLNKCTKVTPTCENDRFDYFPPKKFQFIFFFFVKKRSQAILIRSPCEPSFMREIKRLN